MSEDKILTPEEMYQAAYNRNIMIGNMWLKAQPKPEYNHVDDYKFDFDPKAIYGWSHQLSTGEDVFVRESDSALAIFTKYSHIKIY